MAHLRPGGGSEGKIWSQEGACWLPRPDRTYPSLSDVAAIAPVSVLGVHPAALTTRITRPPPSDSALPTRRIGGSGGCVGYIAAINMLN
jgi:hypothetical protein